MNAEASLRARWPSLLGRTKRVLSIIAFALLPIVLLCVFTLGVIGNHFAFAFHTFWVAARDVLHGRTVRACAHRRRCGSPWLAASAGEARDLDRRAFVGSIAIALILTPTCGWA